MGKILIRRSGFLNPYSALARDLGKIFFASPLKIVLQHNPLKATELLRCREMSRRADSVEKVGISTPVQLFQRRGRGF
jgi:hypothetical protein